MNRGGKVQSNNSSAVKPPPVAVPGLVTSLTSGSKSPWLQGLELSDLSVPGGNRPCLALHQGVHVSECECECEAWWA